MPMKTMLLPLLLAQLMFLAIEFVAWDMHARALMTLASAGVLLCGGVFAGISTRESMTKKAEKRSSRQSEF